MGGVFDPMDLLKGAVLSIGGALVSLPFEVWKTHMGTYRNERTMESFRNIKKGGVGAFWAGWQPKMVESALKGGILLFTKDAVIRTLMRLGGTEVQSGLVGGFCGGVAQVSVLGPCTFLVTAAVTGDKSVTLTQRARDTYAKRGVGGFYQGGTALMLRQGSNWACRQGFTDITRDFLKRRHVKEGASTKKVRGGIVWLGGEGIVKRR
ncbi:mitochondrial carrier domain-containing protein [Ochromonadaceae sp. CCMP2298]|nr:mitochondrial carrier domain-containing protein [Ochromonadaceae sp. CCMP2298]